MKNEQLQKWEDSVVELTNYFIKKYFGKLEDVEYYWIAEDIGGVIQIADYFFNLSDITEFIKYNYSRKKMFEYYDYALEYHCRKRKKDDYLVNIKNYKKLK